MNILPQAPEMNHSTQRRRAAPPHLAQQPFKVLRPRRVDAIEPLTRKLATRTGKNQMARCAMPRQKLGEACPKATLVGKDQPAPRLEIGILEFRLRFRARLRPPDRLVQPTIEGVFGAMKERFRLFPLGLQIHLIRDAIRGYPVGSIERLNGLRGIAALGRRNSNLTPALSPFNPIPSPLKRIGRK
jgi:hypothetical protein